MIKVEYEVLTPLLDFRKAKDNDILVHPEENWRSLCNVGADNQRNLCASGKDEAGDVDQVLSECEYVVEQTYHTQANQQAMMETFRTYCYMDVYGRLNCGVIHPGYLPCKKSSFQCPWNTEIKDPCDQTENRRRFWSKTDRCVRSISGICYMEDRTSVKDHLHKRRIPDRIIPTS